MKLKIDTDKLHLPGPGAAALWEPRLSSRRAERLAGVRELRSLGLPGAEIRCIFRQLAIVAGVREVTRQWPTVDQDRQALQAAAELSQALATVLEGASSRAQAEIAAAACRLRDESLPQGLCVGLRLLAAALQQRIGLMPKQSRRRAPIEIVRVVAEVCGRRLGKVTTWEEGPFRRACVAAFSIAGLPTSPDKAIAAYAAEVDDSQMKSDSLGP